MTDHRDLLLPRKVSWRRAVLLYLAIVSFLAFFRLGQPGLMTMEGMVADGAAYMSRFGDFSVPHVYEEVFTYKPPLAYWMVWAVAELTGSGSEFAIRAPFAASGLLMGLAVLFLVGRVVGPRTGLLCALASTTSALFMTKLRIAEYDMVLAAGVGVAVAAAVSNLGRRRGELMLWSLGYAGLTFAFLAKGIPALMTYFPGLVAAAVVTGQSRRLLRWQHLVPLAVSLAVVLFWLGAMYRSAGYLAFVQPLDEAGVRGLTWTPMAFLWTFAKPFFVVRTFLPWSLILLSVPWRREIFHLRAERPVAGVAACFLIGGVVAFMATPTHQFRYYLPLCVPMGLCVALLIAGEPASSPTARRLQRGAALAIFALAGTITVLCVLLAFPPTMESANRLLLAFSALAALTATVYLYRRGALGVATVLLLTSTQVWALDTFAISPHRAVSRVLKSVALAFERDLPVEEDVWVLGPALQAGRYSSLYYYLRRRTRAFNADGELPPAGSWAVLTDADFERLAAQRPEHGFDIVSTAERHGDSFHLCVRTTTASE